jgi:hypothetical protein
MNGVFVINEKEGNLAIILVFLLDRKKGISALH